MRVQGIRRGGYQADEPSGPGPPHLPALSLGKGPRDLLDPHFLSGKQLVPHPTVGDKGNGVQIEAITELCGKQGKEANATNRAAEWSSRMATDIHCSAL